MYRPIDGLAQFARQHPELIARVPDAPLIFRPREVARGLFGELRDLPIQDRKKQADGDRQRSENRHIDHADRQGQRKHEAVSPRGDRPAKRANQRRDQIGKEHRQHQ